jgi:hypothetical protein
VCGGDTCGKGVVNGEDDDQGIGLMVFIHIKEKRVMKPLVITLSGMGKRGLGGR